MSTIMSPCTTPGRRPATRPYICVTDPRLRDSELRRRLPQGRVVTRALAIKLDDDCIMRWGDVFHEEMFPGKRSQISPERYRERLTEMQSIIVNYLAHRVYCEFPNLPRLGRAGLLVPRRGDLMWLFVFKDNSSREVLDAPIDMDDVHGVQEYLGVTPQRAKWYDVTHWVH